MFTRTGLLLTKSLCVVYTKMKPDATFKRKNRKIKYAEIVKSGTVENDRKKRAWTPAQKSEIVHKHLNEHVSVCTLGGNILRRGEGCIQP